MLAWVFACAVPRRPVPRPYRPYRPLPCHPSWLSVWSLVACVRQNHAESARSSLTLVMCNLTLSPPHRAWMSADALAFFSGIFSVFFCDALLVPFSFQSVNARNNRESPLLQHLSRLQVAERIRRRPRCGVRGHTGQGGHRETGTAEARWYWKIPIESVVVVRHRRLARRGEGGLGTFPRGKTSFMSPPTSHINQSFWNFGCFVPAVLMPGVSTTGEFPI